jgi:hypothetical protein
MIEKSTERRDDGCGETTDSRTTSVRRTCSSGPVAAKDVAIGEPPSTGLDLAPPAAALPDDLLLDAYSRAVITPPRRSARRS